MTGYLPNSVFYGKDPCKNFKDKVEPVSLKEMEEWVRQLTVEIQKGLSPFKGKKNSNVVFFSL